MKNKMNNIFNHLFLLAFTFVIIGLNGKAAVALEEVKFVRELTEGLQEPVDAVVNDLGEIYVLDRQQEKVFVYTPQGSLKFSFGQQGSNIGQFNGPRSIALSLTGEILIADTGNSRIQTFTPEGEFLFQLGHAGKEPGQFKSPDSIAVDQLGNIYVGDSANKTITKFSPNGVFLDHRKLDFKPTDMVFDHQQNLYILMPGIGRIIKFDLQTYDFEQITFKLEGKDLISKTAGIAVDGRGDIYFIETLNHSVKKIDQNKTLLVSFGSQGEGVGQFNSPLGIAADGNGHIYVADAKNQRVQVLEIAGSAKPDLQTPVYLPPILEYDGAIETKSPVVDIDSNKEQGLYVLSDKEGELLAKGPDYLTFERIDNVVSDFRRPQSLAFDARGRLIIADTGHHQMHVVDGDGRPAYFFGKRGDRTSEFQSPGGVAADSQGYIYVADTNNHRIQKFSDEGIYLNSFGEKSDKQAEPGTFLYPTSLAFDSLDRLHVLDSRNKRIQILNKDGKYIKSIGGLSADSTIAFEDPVDLSLDEHDYLFVADRGRHKIMILDTQGELVMDFGSNGRGPSYFPQLTSVEAAEGKIYVGDEDTSMVRVFSFKAEEKYRENRIFLTKISEPLSMVNASEKIQYAMARKLTIEEATKELAFQLGVQQDALSDHIKVEAEELMVTGQIKLTVSIPKEIPLETSAVLSKM